MRTHQDKGRLGHKLHHPKLVADLVVPHGKTKFLQEGRKPLALLDIGRTTSLPVDTVMRCAPDLAERRKIPQKLLVVSITTRRHAYRSSMLDARQPHHHRRFRRRHHSPSDGFHRANPVARSIWSKIAITRATVYQDRKASPI